MEAILEQLKKINPIEEKDYASDGDEDADKTFINLEEQRPKTSRPIDIPLSRNKDGKLTAAADKRFITAEDIKQSISSPYIKVAKFYDNDIDFDEDDKPKNKSKNWEIIGDFYSQSLPLKVALGSTIINKFKMFYLTMREQDRIINTDSKEPNTLASVIHSKKDKKEDTANFRISHINTTTKPTTITKQKNNSTKSGDVSRSNTIRKNSSSTVNKRGGLTGVDNIEVISANTQKKGVQIFGQSLETKKFRFLQPYYYRQPTNKADLINLPDFHTEPIFTVIENLDKSKLADLLC